VYISPQILGTYSSKPKATRTFYTVCDFMMGLGKTKLYTKFEVASFSHSVIIEGEPPDFRGTPLVHGHDHFSFAYDFVMGNRHWHSPATPKETFSHGSEFLFVAPGVRFDLGSINLVFPKLGAMTIIRDHPRGSRVVPLDSTNIISY